MLGVAFKDCTFIPQVLPEATILMYIQTMSITSTSILALRLDMFAAFIPLQQANSQSMA